MVDSIETYKEGRFDQAMTNMMMAKDLLEDRFEWHGHLRGYIKDVLKLTPMLSRGGVQIDPIQDSLRNLSSAMQKREYTEARQLLDLRRQETRLWKQLWSLEEYITKRIGAKPISRAHGPQGFGQEAARVLPAHGRGYLRGGAGQQARGGPEGRRGVHRGGGLRRVPLEGRKAPRRKDEAAWYAMWCVGLGLLKLAAPLVPEPRRGVLPAVLPGQGGCAEHPLRRVARAVQVPERLSGDHQARPARDEEEE